MSSNSLTQNYKIIIAYDGTHYCGWQVQSNGISIQQLIQEKASLILKNSIRIIGSGRTDAGVHAIGQAANFYSPWIQNLPRFLISLNALLPFDIRILSIEPVDKHFHAQYSALGKIYYYHLHLEKVMNPFKRLYCHHQKQQINIEILKQASQVFLGTHNFTSFANQPHLGSASKDPIRTIHRLDVIQEPGGVRLEFEGNGFLYKMVRNITGTLIDVATGKTSLEELMKILAAQDRKVAGQAAPSQGLFLAKVIY